MKKKLLIIEDNKKVVRQLRKGLAGEYDISVAPDAEKARKLLATGVFPVVTLDLGLPPYPDSPDQGFKLLEDMPVIAPRVRVIVIAGHTEEENAVRAIALGAADFCEKPIDLKLLKIILSRTFRIHELEEANRRLQEQSCQSGSLCGMVGVSPLMTKVFDCLQHVSITDYPVLITGATGTGKEMVARAIHTLSKRSDKPMVIINCGAIPDSLLESELFGFEKGSFTGAEHRKIGRFEQADNGTIFLDEIGDMPASLQVKLLRFLQESTIERVGGTGTIHLNVRIIAATNIDLHNAVRMGIFREDLFYRLNVVPIKLPDLRERQEDILLLAHHFLTEETRRLGRGPVNFSPSAASILTSWEWPGNVRELQNRIRRALGMSKGKLITPTDLGFTEPADKHTGHNVTTVREARAAAEREVILRAMAMTGNNISRAAKLLDVSRPTLHDLLKKHGITKKGGK